MILSGRIPAMFGFNDQWLTIKLDGSTGGDVQASGGRLQIVDVDGALSQRRVIVKCKDGSRENRLIAAPAPGSLADPTLGGGFLEIANPTTGETDPEGQS